MPTEAKDLVTLTRELLESAWREVSREAEAGNLRDAIEDVSLKEAIRRSINSGTISYRYVLPTQIAAKLANPALDCHSLQVAGGRTGAFDARSVCHKVVVPFDRNNDSVLGGSPEPYVNNPLRIPEVTRQYLAQQKNKDGWEDLCRVLDVVEARSDMAFTESTFKQALIEIHRRLADVHVTYPTPMRISLDRCVSLVSKFISEASGGDRPQAVASALFVTIGQVFHLFTTVRRSATNAADTASGQVADLECVSADGRIVLAVEVKDKALTLRQVQDKPPGIREQRVTEVIFLALHDVDRAEQGDITDLTGREFSSGQNIYVVQNFEELLRSVLMLVGEAGRRIFLEAVGHELDEYRSDIAHRKSWAKLLSQV